MDLLGHNAFTYKKGPFEVVMPIYREETLFKMLIMSPNEQITMSKQQGLIDEGEETKYPPLVVAKLNRIAGLKAFYMNGGWADAYPTLRLIGGAMLSR